MWRFKGTTYLAVLSVLVLSFLLYDRHLSMSVRWLLCLTRYAVFLQLGSKVNWLLWHFNQRNSNPFQHGKQTSCYGPIGRKQSPTQHPLPKGFTRAVLIILSLHRRDLRTQPPSTMRLLCTPMMIWAIVLYKWRQKRWRGARIVRGSFMEDERTWAVSCIMGRN